MNQKSTGMVTGGYIPALTGVRAVAAYMVFIHHHSNPGIIPIPIFKIVKQFHTGVAIFFVLSGFLIALRYYNASEISTQWFRKYLKNRIGRIYPMYFLLTLATFLAASLSGNFGGNGMLPPWLLTVLNITFLRGFFDALKFTGIAQGWTLTVEECFYFSAPIFFFLIHKNKKFLWRLPFILIGLGCLLVIVFSKINFYGFYGSYQFMLIFTFNGRCIEFFLGIYLALQILNKKPKKNKYPLYTGLGLITMILSILLMASIPLVNESAMEISHPLVILSNNLFLPVGITFFFYGLITEKSFIGMFLGSRVMQLLGKSSYIFYLIHFGFLADLVLLYCKIFVGKLYHWFSIMHFTLFQDHLNSILLSVILAFIILNILSIILFKTVEDPLNRLIRKLSFQKKRLSNV